MTSPTPASAATPTRSWWWWVLGGAAYGLGLRVLFGALPASYQGVMSTAFILGTPFVLGALTVYGQRHHPRTWSSMIVTPWITVGLMLLGCAATLLEGSICLAIMSPLFLALGSLGGLAMGLALRWLGAHRTELRTIAALPVLLLLTDGHIPLQDAHQVIRRSIVIDAPPALVWNEILDARAIRADELPWSLTHAIGVPKPLEGVNIATPDGEVRYSKWERGVHFRGVVTHRRAPQSITWHYAFDKDSFPAGSMDDHVAIGGRYFDLRDTTLNLQPLPGNRTRLEIVAHYRVGSSINFYAIPMANLIGTDFVDTILGLYKSRSERALSQPTQTSVAALAL